MKHENIIKMKIRERYTKESQNSCDLSCGSNLEYLEIQKGDFILDLGCGRGKETLQAAMLTGPEGKAIGFDITEAMINEASAQGENLENVSFILGDIEKLPFEDEYFDAVMSNCVINHARNKIKVYGEIFRTLKTGGRMVISDAVTKHPLPPEIKKDSEAWAQCFGGAITEEEYLHSINLTGFTRVDILQRREYLKNGFEFISLTLIACKH